MKTMMIPGIEPSEKTAVIIGNGPSRTAFKFEDLQELGTTFGCNAAYRDFTPDFLISFDPKILTEIKASSFPKDRLIVPTIREQYEPRAFFPQPIRPRANAGMVAMGEAIRKGFTQLLCFGFGFLIIADEYRFGNIYEKTNGYEESLKVTKEDVEGRINYFCWFVQQHPTIDFIMIYPSMDKEIYIPNYKNVKVIPI